MNMKRVEFIKYAAIVLMVAGSFFSNTGCGIEKKTTFEEIPTFKNKNGVVKDFGSPAVDGCGWVIIVDDNVYAPVGGKLDNEFYKDNLKILMDFKKLSSFRDCNWWSPDYGKVKEAGKNIYPEIEILTIKMR